MFGKFSECRLDHFVHIKYVIWHENYLSCHARLHQHLPRVLASTRQTRQHLPSTFARTGQTHQHLPKAIFEKNVTRLAKFVRVIRESREFGASSHCLLFTLFIARRVHIPLCTVLPCLIARSFTIYAESIRLIRDYLVLIR
jgi:hypothetical protein